MEFVNLALPPSLRAKAENVLLLMLLPDGLSKDAQKKYYNFACDYELQDLFQNGVGGVRVKVFGSTLDTPGRAELLGPYYSSHHAMSVIFSITHPQACKLAKHTRVAVFVSTAGQVVSKGNANLMATAGFWLPGNGGDNGEWWTEGVYMNTATFAIVCPRSTVMTTLSTRA